MGDLREQNGVVLEESLVTSSSSYVGPEVWVRAEAATGEIIRQVQPTVVSEERRKDVIDYVQGLLKGYLGCEVFPFGSVPLKTYLPDGDIDLTAFCGFNLEEAFASKVCTVLDAEDRNPAAKFVVKDVQYIHAEVKLVKCLVQNIVVDISFNQIGGLCTLCFLEEIDHLIGKNHLFKRSIILIKAWCYYESRILGAHHGLISTYALETLVLYIFHLFHSSLNGPFAVLHKFLDYFSKFDWENCCVNLSGPVHVASTPEVAEKSETSGWELLLSDVFMRECVRKFSVPNRGAEMNNKTFMQKHLNIIDPLKENNNLGRSVSKGNYFRIRSAFSYGARKLGQIMLQPPENIIEEVRKFFTNTLDRHGTGQRPDVQEHFQLSSCKEFISLESLPYSEPYQNHIYSHEEGSMITDNQPSENMVDSENSKHVTVSDFRDPDKNLEGTIVDHKKVDDFYPSTVDDIRDLALIEKGDEFCPSTADDEKLSPDGLRYAPHLFFPHPLENGKMENGVLDEKEHSDSSSTFDRHSHQKVNGFVSREHDSTRLCNNSDTLKLPIYGNGHLGAERNESPKPSPDLSGDVDFHLDNLQYGRWWYDQGSEMRIQPMPLILPPMFPPNVSWDGHMNVNGGFSRPPFFPSSPLPAHYTDEIPKARGLGTYFPNMNHQSYRERPSPKGRYQGQMKSPRINGRLPTLQSPLRQDIGRPKFPDNHESFPRGNVYQESNGFVQAPENVLEYGPLSPPPEAVLPEMETCILPDSNPSSGSENGEPVYGAGHNRLSPQSYQLKDEEDFPPLSG